MRWNSCMGSRLLSGVFYHARRRRCCPARPAPTSPCRGGKRPSPLVAARLERQRLVALLGRLLGGVGLLFDRCRRRRLWRFGAPGLAVAQGGQLALEPVQLVIGERGFFAALR